LVPRKQFFRACSTPHDSRDGFEWNERDALRAANPGCNGVRAVLYRARKKKRGSEDPR